MDEEKLKLYKEKNRIRAKERYKNKKKEICEYNKRYWKENKERIKERNRLKSLSKKKKYYIKNKDKIAQYNKQYWIKKRERKNIIPRKRNTVEKEINLVIDFNNI
jgi:hypothetical protein